ncbi:hypothetical protein CDAR_256741 [Caerostris darwini]|uniref:Uncharacterized protein n=1 Tax=Caerostris darwini TaxID=1538125 RepID=A0AAV4Q051_9ARAC|nr:hypothetical protein CDAR_256741 [Caerostris darwini]
MVEEACLENVPCDLRYSPAVFSVYRMIFKDPIDVWKSCGGVCCSRCFRKRECNGYTIYGVPMWKKP